uniref:Uncharacterized protein n=1 Tax=Oryza glumipatula TaxID=40148 RepID=A0A0E0BCR5_9ORYZ
MAQEHHVVDVLVCKSTCCCDPHDCASRELTPARIHRTLGEALHQWRWKHQSRRLLRRRWSSELTPCHSALRAESARLALAHKRHVGDVVGGDSTGCCYRRHGPFRELTLAGVLGALALGGEFH